MLRENFLDIIKTFKIEEDSEYDVYRLPDEEPPDIYNYWKEKNYSYALYDSFTKKEISEDEVRRRWDDGKTLNWKYISKWVTLSESFIREFRDYVDWKLIKKCQDVSKDFLKEMTKKKKKK